jgi:hypothetical protein
VIHSILIIVWHLLSRDTDYDDLGGDYFLRDPNTARRSRDHHVAGELAGKWLYCNSGERVARRSTAASMRSSRAVTATRTCCSPAGP